MTCFKLPVLIAAFAILGFFLSWQTFMVFVAGACWGYLDGYFAGMIDGRLAELERIKAALGGGSVARMVERSQ